VWNFLIDLSLIEWLEAEGIPYDVITDDDVHREGVAPRGFRGGADRLPPRSTGR
jgi:hypothetical protein